MANEDMRVEHDTMGEVRVPAQALWGAQTQRAVDNFPISGVRIDPAVISALAYIKASAARVNAELGVVPADIAEAVATAAARIAGGEYADQFPIDVFQTGSGTSTNMNVNEVVATLASRELGSTVHPNDHVNASQSSNDTVPTAVHVAAAGATVNDLLPALDQLATSFENLSARTQHVVKAGRTHLMDATPVTLGQEFGGHAAQVRRGIERIIDTLPRVVEVPLGGTATGTGINTPPGFAVGVIADLSVSTGLPITEARDHFEAHGSRDALVELSGALRVLAVSLTKICNDLRWMSSGPNAGLGEIHLPDLQPGSSIMPGKVNPVIPEAVLQICAQVIGHDATLAWAGASGNFELNVMVPVISRSLLEQIRLLTRGSALLAERVVDGVEPDERRARELAESSPAIVTPLARPLGYEAAAKIAKHAVAERITIKAAAIALGVVERGELTEDELDRLLDVSTMTHP
ncbi:class II fumarate hydratase [Kineosporia sp. NBRC 101731]|uniref:class II fumarate hydratase n=1 Tax=Kineosporia sp. NBRC 101731 TaxID=3032199 RepID=UPI00249FA601|nr:class II fumarate hydratase [Kineosporia sp. NBRC 101731]GLY28606.1 fumarate hydratase class II [Kineosporia sp. NBRC 101731]